MVQKVQNSTTETPMYHFECLTCGITATMVATETGKLAWLDHMNRHALPEHFRIWTWTVQQLPDLDIDVSPR